MQDLVKLQSDRRLSQEQEARKAALSLLLSSQTKLFPYDRACRALTAARVVLELNGYTANKFVDHDPVGYFINLEKPHPIDVSVRETRGIAHIGGNLVRLVNCALVYQSQISRLRDAISEEFVIAILKPIDGQPVYLPVVEELNMERNLARCLLMTLADLLRDKKVPALSWPGQELLD